MREGGGNEARLPVSFALHAVFLFALAIVSPGIASRDYGTSRTDFTCRLDLLEPLVAPGARCQVSDRLADQPVRGRVAESANTGV